MTLLLYVWTEVVYLMILVTSSAVIAHFLPHCRYLLSFPLRCCDRFCFPASGMIAFLLLFPAHGRDSVR